jgi:hypothetical protein
MTYYEIYCSECADDDDEKYVGQKPNETHSKIVCETHDRRKHGNSETAEYREVER